MFGEIVLEYAIHIIRVWAHLVGNLDFLSGLDANYICALVIVD